MSAKDIQIAGTHYKQMSIQPIEYILANNLGYVEGNIIKYVSRWKTKGKLEDLRKAKHYLEILIEEEIEEGLEELRKKKSGLDRLIEKEIMEPMFMRKGKPA